MIQTIVMAKRYNKLPSEILKLKDDYMAYMIDEVSLYLEDMATDKKGNTDWNKLLKKKEVNKSMIDHIKEVNKGR